MTIFCEIISPVRYLIKVKHFWDTTGGFDGTLIGEDGLKIMAGAELVEWYLCV
jgi:hypothetical protein